MIFKISSADQFVDLRISAPNAFVWYDIGYVFGSSLESLTLRAATFARTSFSFPGEL